MIGFIAQTIYNRAFSSKEKHKAKTAVQLFPHLSDDVPEALDDERVVKIKRILSQVSGGSGEQSSKSIEFIKEKVLEETKLEEEKEEPDWYLITRLNQLIDGVK